MGRRKIGQGRGGNTKISQVQLPTLSLLVCHWAGLIAHPGTQLSDLLAEHREGDVLIDKKLLKPFVVHFIIMYGNYMVALVVHIRWETNLRCTTLHNRRCWAARITQSHYITTVSPCVYECAYLSMHVCTNVHLCVSVLVHVSVVVCKHMCMAVFVCVWVCLCIWVCMYECVSVHVWKHASVHECACMHEVCVWVCLCAYKCFCVWVCLYIWVCNYMCGDNFIRICSKCLNSVNTTERKTRDRTTSNNLTVLSFPFLL